MFVVWAPLSDIVLALIPLLFIRTLTRPLREKIVLGVLLALGLACCAVTIPRLVAYFHTGLGYDITYVGTSALYLTELELFLGIWAACIPTLRNLFEGWLVRMGFDISGGSSSDQQTANFSWSRKMTKKYGNGGDMEKAAESPPLDLAAGDGSEEHVQKSEPVVMKGMSTMAFDLFREFPC